MDDFPLDGGTGFWDLGPTAGAPTAFTVAAAGMLALIGLGFAVVVVAVARRIVRVVGASGRALRTRGVVVDAEVYRPDLDSLRRETRVTVDFTDATERVHRGTFTRTTDSTRYAPGQQIDLYYDPEHPDVVMHELPSTANIVVSSTAFVVVVVVFLVMFTSVGGALLFLT